MLRFYLFRYHHINIVESRLWASAMQMLKRSWLLLSEAGRKWKALPPAASSQRQPPTGSRKAKNWEGYCCQEQRRLKVCHHFGFKNGSIIFLHWIPRILLKSKLKGLGPHVAVHALKSSEPPTPPHFHHHHTTQTNLIGRYFSVAQREVIGYSGGSV